jgi:hypothetical protein
VSLNINLVEYQAGDDGKLYETKTELIESSFVTKSLLNKLQQSFPLVERNVFEEVGSQDHYTIECFADSDVESIIKLLEEIFLSVLKSDSEKLLNKVSSPNTETLPTLSSEHINSNELNDSISRFRTLTNVINIFMLKHTQYGSNASVVLKMG